MNLVRLIFGVIPAVYMITAATGGVLTMLISYILIRPFSESLFIRWVCVIQGSFLHHMIFILEVMLKIKLRVTGMMPSSEPAMFISNHRTMEWIAMFMMAARKGMLPYVRTIVKNSLLMVPGFGPGMWACYWPMITRDFKKDEKVLRKIFMAYHKADLPVQLWSYPESTRLTSEKLAESQKLQKEKGYPVWNHVLLPRNRGFLLATVALQGIVGSLYEVTVNYDGWSTETPGIFEIFFCDRTKPHVIHAHLTRTPFERVPTEINANKQWLIDSFERKEKLLEHYAKEHKFPGDEVTSKMTYSQMIPHLIFWALYATVFYFLLFRWILSFVA